MKNKLILVIFSLLVISAISYLPLIGQIGYLYDDWYLMYSVGAYGPNAFIDIFSVDRPGRALVMIPAYMLFGDNPLYYNLSGYVLRLISALAFLWLLRMLFPRQRLMTFLASLFFLIYPGFLSQPNGLDYQSHLVGLAAAQLSIALTIRAIMAERRATKMILHLLSVVLGLLYLSQMEWYIGFEFLRWASVFLLSSRMDGAFIRKAWRTVQLAYPSIAVPLIFLIWRIYFFQSERGATDIDIQFEQVKLYPLQTLYHWAVQVIQDLYDVALAAWVTPLSQLTGYVQLWGGVLAVITAGLVFYAISFHSNEGDQQQSANFTREALLLGLVVTVGGLIPIAMVNRDVVFPWFSRYSLVSSAGVAIFISTLLMALRRNTIRNGLVAVLVLISILTHHANAMKVVQQTASTRDFWWQVSWRIPQFEERTTLIANYPGAVLEEDYFIWGPANLIYFPEKQNENEIQPVLFAALLSSDTVEKVLARERQEYDKRKNIITYANYRNILVMTKPNTNACVHIIDGTNPEYSVGERDFVREIEPYSEVEHILVDETPHTPPTVVFGPEPSHDWCFYYQKADLARQRGAWEDVYSIGEQAFGQGFEPQDLIEWIPFLQAYAVRGDIERLTEVASFITRNSYVSLQACQIIGSMKDIPVDVMETINSLYCSN